MRRMRSARRLRNQNDIFVRSAEREKGFLYLRDWRLKLCASHSYHVTSFVNCVLNGESFSLTPITPPPPPHLYHARALPQTRINFLYYVCTNIAGKIILRVRDKRDFQLKCSYDTQTHTYIHIQACSVSTRKHM